VSCSGGSLGEPFFSPESVTLLIGARVRAVAGNSRAVTATVNPDSTIVEPNYGNNSDTWSYSYK
jgi:hypothetical protein